MIVGLLAKLFTDWKEVVAAVKRAAKGVGMVWKWIMGSAIRRKEVSDKLDYIVHELKFNGGGSTKDAVKRIEHYLEQVAVLVDTCNRRMDISELANERMTFRVDAHGECTEVNEVFLKKFGYLEGDVLGFAFEQIVHNDDVPEMRIKWERAISSKGRYYDEQRIFKSNSEAVKCCVRAFPVLLRGELIEFIGYIEIDKNQT